MPRQQLSDLDFNGVARIINLPAGTASGHPITFEQLGSYAEGLAWKDNARVATQANISLASPGATIDGITLVASDRVLVRAQTTGAENGVYVWNGAATPMTRSADASTFDKLESAVVTIDEGTSVSASFRQSAVNGTIGVTSVAWVSFGTSAPAATDTTAGIAEYATQAETDAGVADNLTITPLKLATWAGRVRKFAANLGDGAATQYDFTHNFNTFDTLVEVVRNTGARDTVGCDISRPTVNTVRLNFAAAPTSNQFRVLIRD